MKIKYLGLIFLALGLGSCITQREYSELEQENQRNLKEKERLKWEVADLTTKSKAINDELGYFHNQAKEYEAEISRLSKETSDLKKDIDNLQRDIEECNRRNREAMASKSQDLDKMSQDLLNARSTLNKRAQELADKEEKFEELKREFAKKEDKLKELEKALEAKQGEVNNIQTMISNALLGFRDKGLEITNKDGRVYVSMDEKLLFKSGSWQVGQDGIAALKEIALVLEENPDITVMVEGHTDNVPLRGNQQVKDNWDLSVMRATAITKILLNSAIIAPERIIPSGRGEFSPIMTNASAEGRAKNRRTEIILTPKVNELLKLIE